MKKKHWFVLIVLISAGLLAAVAIAARSSIERIYWAHRLHLFTPVKEIAGNKFFAEARLLIDLTRLRNRIGALNKTSKTELKPLLAAISRRQAVGKNVSYSLQIYREIRWWSTFTSDYATTESRIAELKKSLEAGDDQFFADQQVAADGSWGPGYTVWFMKLYGTTAALNDDAVQKYPLTFLDRINSPEKLDAHLKLIVLNDFLKTGRLNRMELDETVAGIGRLLFQDVKADYTFDPALKEAYLKFLDEYWQNPDTGCWGTWYVGRDGMAWRSDDVGMTFHIVSQRKGRVNHIDKIARRVLELSKIDFPTGIRMNGQYENHLNWDTVKIFRYAWPSLDEGTKEAARKEIAAMLHWCLTESYQPDGTFKLSVIDDTLGDAMLYGLSFLKEIGYFRKSDRFWTAQDFSDAKSLCDRVRAKLESTGLKNVDLNEAYKKLLDCEKR